MVHWCIPEGLNLCAWYIVAHHNWDDNGECVVVTCFLLCAYSSDSLDSCRGEDTEFVQVPYGNQTSPLSNRAFECGKHKMLCYIQ
jgi:hypothetical protein